MRHRAFDLFLVLVVLVGGALAWKSGRDRARLSVAHQRLIRAAGEFPIGDPTKVHVQALDIGKPGLFAWRIHLPPNYQWIARDCRGVRSYPPSSDPAEFIASIQFRQESHDWLGLNVRFFNGTSGNRFGDQELAGLLRGRLGEIHVEQLGTPELATVDPNGSAVLLRLTLSETMQAEARRKLPPSVQNQFIPVLYELSFGRQPPRPTTAPSGY